MEETVVTAFTESKELDRRMWHIRATAWELMALSFGYPNEELSHAIVSGQWTDAAREISAALDLELPGDFGIGLIANDTDSDLLLHNLRVEATRLFVGAPTPAVSPYEGVWRAEADGVSALLFVNPHSREVESFLGSCGLGRPEGTNEPLDHLATECELLEHLALRAADINVGQNLPASLDLPGGSPEAAYARFLNDHILTWMTACATAVQQQSANEFYRASATFLSAMIEREAVQ